MHVRSSAEPFLGAKRSAQDTLDLDFRIHPFSTAAWNHLLNEARSRGVRRGGLATTVGRADTLLRIPEIRVREIHCHVSTRPT